MVVGNFDVVERGATVTFPRTGTWYDFFAGEAFEVDETTTTLMLPPGEQTLTVTVTNAGGAVTVIEIPAQQPVLLRRCFGGLDEAGQVRIAVQRTALALRQGQLARWNACGLARRTTLAGRAIENRLAAAEADMGQRIVERRAVIGLDLGEDFSLQPVGEIRARSGRRQKEGQLLGGERMGHASAPERGASIVSEVKTVIRTLDRN